MEEDHGLKWKEMEIDCLVCIFQKLSLRDLTLSVPFVSKTWFVASLSPLCWRVLDFRRVLDFVSGSKSGKPLPTRFSFSAFMKFAVRRSCGTAVELHFPLFFQVSTEDLVYISAYCDDATNQRRCPRLKVLGMDSLLPESELHFPRLIGKWKELEYLEMETGPSSFPDLAAAIGVGCGKFRGLSMSGTSVGTEDALAIVSHLPKLKSLNLSRSCLPKRELLLILDGCGDLDTLTVKYCVGFGAEDEEILGRGASGDVAVEREGSKLREDFGCGGGAASMSVGFIPDDDCMGLYYCQGL